MRITRILIDGFGQFHDTPLEPAPGLTVIRGPNEAGKTTLLAFIRAILFGFETDRYPALRGGRRGGWLDVEMRDGRAFRIERHGDRGGAGTLRVVDDRHVDRGAPYLATLLSGVERTVYRNIFAFGLEELTEFQRLTDREVNAHIYGASLGTGSVSGLEVEKALSSEMEGLFKPGGQKPVINSLLRELEEAEDELRGRNLPAEYGEAGRRLAEVERSLAETGRRHADAAGRRRSQQRLVDGWEAWLRLADARAARERIEPFGAFGGETRESLGRLEKGLQDADIRLREAEQESERAGAARDAVVLDDAALARRDELEGIRDAAQDARRRRTALADIEGDLKAAKTAVDALVARLGPGWTPDRIEAFDDSLAVHAEIDGRFRTRLASTAEALDAARRDLVAVGRRQEELADEAKQTEIRAGKLEEELGGRSSPAMRERDLLGLRDLARRHAELGRTADSAPEGDLDAERETLGRRIGALGDLAGAVQRRDSVRQLLAGLGTPAATAPASLAASRVGVPLSQLLLIAAGAFAAVALIAVWAAPPMAAPLVGLALVALAVLAAVTFLRRPADKSATDATRRTLQEQDARATAEIGRLAAALGIGTDATADQVRVLTASADEERRRLDGALERRNRAVAAAEDRDRLAGEIAAAATALGLPPEPADEDLDRLAREIEADRDREARRAGLLERAAGLRASLTEQGRRHGEQETLVSERETEALQARKDWSSWLADHGLDETLDRETAARVVATVSEAKRSVASMRGLEERRADLALADQSFSEGVADLAELLSAGWPGDGDALRAAAELEKRLADALEGERTRAGLERETEDREKTRARAEADRAAAQSELEDFLAGLGTESPETLRAELGRSERAAQLDKEIEAATRALGLLSGPGPALAALEEELGGITDIATVRTAIEDLDRELENLAAQRDHLNQEAGDLRSRRATMEQDAAATELRQQAADARGRLESAAESWAVLSLARELLTRSRLAYEEAHRPAVVQAAERHFEAWTGGRYRRIVVPLGGAIESVVRRDGTPLRLADLSRGTAEQLYLALRFGLVERFAETTGEPLPVVMDDILVNFDDERAALAARSIEELARTCQVIYFTCHPETPLRADAQKTLDPFAPAD